MSMYNKVEICGVNTSKLITISEAEKRELLKKSREGDKKAREKLINANLKLVLSVLQSFSARGGSPDDLFQVGCIGLIKAVDNFDLSQEVKFSTYAVPMDYRGSEEIPSGRQPYSGFPFGKGYGI